MQHLKQLAWLFVAGLFAAAGACVAILVAVVAFDRISEADRKERHGIDPRNYQPPKTGELVFTDIRLTKLTISGGVFGYVENRTKRDIRSFSADLSLTRNGVVLHRCSEVVSVSVRVGERASFELLCSRLDRSTLTDDIQPNLHINWVYPSLDK